MTNLSRLLELAGLKESDYSANQLAGKSLEELQEKKADLEAQIKGCTILTEHVEDLKFKLFNVDKAILEAEDQLDEKAPADQEEFVKSAKSDFKKRYGKRWKEVLYATAWKKHKNEATDTNYLEIADKLFEHLSRTENSKPFSQMDKLKYFLKGKNPQSQDDAYEIADWIVANIGQYYWVDAEDILIRHGFDDAYTAMSERMGESGMHEAAKTGEELQNLQPSSALDKDEIGNVFDGHDEEKANAQELHNDAMGITQDEETKVSVPADVFSQIDRRINELKQSMELYDKTTFKTHYDNKQKAIENLEFLRDKLKLGTMEAYKQAQIHFGTIASIYAGNLFPAKLVDFLHDGQASEKKEVAFGDAMKGNPDKPSESDLPHNSLYKTLNTNIYPQKGEKNVPKKD